MSQKTSKHNKYINICSFITIIIIKNFFFKYRETNVFASNDQMSVQPEQPHVLFSLSSDDGSIIC